MNIVPFAFSSVAGNVDTDVVVPADGYYKLLYGHVILTTDATVANRRVDIEVLDDAGTPALVFDVHSGAVQAASGTVHYEFIQGIYRETTVTQNALQVPIPTDFIIPSGYTLRLTIDAGVAGDSYDLNYIIESMGTRNK